MELLVFVTALVLMTSGVQATSHLSFNSTLELSITRDGCNTTKLCLETPDDCSPDTDATCLFTSVTSSAPTPPNGTDLSIELRGESAGYIALALTQNANEGTSMVFVCARNLTGGNFFFRTRTLNNTDHTLQPSERRVKQIRGNVTGDVIRCEFTITAVNASAAATSTAATSPRAPADSTFVVLLGNGTTTNGNIGNFNVNLNRGPLNLADPVIRPMDATPTTAATSTPTTAATTTPTTAATTTTANSTSTTVQPHAVLVLLGVVAMAATSLGA